MNDSEWEERLEVEVDDAFDRGHEEGYEQGRKDAIAKSLNTEQRYSSLTR